MSTVAFILLYGLSYGLVLCLIALGLVITMGLMHVINLGHGAFAAIGGYLAISLMQQQGWPYAVAVPTAVLCVAAFGVLAERVLYVRLYKRSHLDQVLVTIGFNFVVIAVVTMLFGPNIVRMELPTYLRGNIDLGIREFELYRVVASGICIVIIGGLWWVFERTSTGARLRAAVDNQGMAQAMGMNVPMLFSATFALGCGLAALGGILAAPMLPMEPMWPMKYLVLMLVIVSLAGHGQVSASVAVAILVGVVETAGRYLFPQYGAFFIYLLLIGLMVWRPKGLLVRRQTA
ncbi:amino acid/amide ABC transporter membrane protein 1 (HAAT family) [Acidovorax sp. 100]|uniref:branched-chain amino acid ABC transporter permease n=1 Tax=Acidovorax sp. 100 TaxID=2135635 RepID=UPI000F157114|nr:branched-chain amino acid ABC transporter permease [Acidovorax sp. 100]RMA59943.1 amino acid/amide ABC transporter membrane protein 1 (HAAT family) [Acidovorax sp. 100]